jgi:N-acetylmuramoyl-L-alanine amidase
MDNNFSGWYCKVNTIKDIGLSLWDSLDENTRVRIIRVAKGEIILVKEDLNNGWVIAEYQNKTGYVDKQYLIKIKENESNDECGEDFKVLYIPQEKNRCFQKKRPAQQTGILVHSTGANNPYIHRYVDGEEFLGANEYQNHWNNSSANTCMHGWVGYDKDKSVIAVQTLPYEYACWGCGGGTKGSYNYDPTSSYPTQRAHIQFEICQASNTNSEYYWKAIDVAENYCVKLCKQFGFTEKNITTHKEAAEAGYASNHGDPQNWMKYFGDTIEKFRERIAIKLGDAPSFVEYVAEVNTENDIGLSLWTTLDIKTRIRIIRVAKGEILTVKEDLGN